MTPYASMTGNRRNMAAIRAAGWRVMISPMDPRSPGPTAYAVDNGAWGAFAAHGKGGRATAVPDLTRFESCLARYGAGADFIVVPDIVMGGAASWALSRAWLRRLRRRRSLRRAVLLIAVQNGFDPATIAPYLDSRVGIFVGGDDEFKESTMAVWAGLARSRGAICHVGRVNSARRIRICEEAGVHSFDGSCVSRYSIKLPLLDGARYKRTLLGEIARRAA